VIETSGDAQNSCDLLKKIVFYVTVLAGDLAGNLDVAARGQRWQQVEFLKDEADLALAHLSPLRVGHPGKVVSVDQDAA